MPKFVPFLLMILPFFLTSFYVLGEMPPSVRPTLNTHLIQSYLKPAHLISQQDLNKAARVLGTSEGRKFLSDHQAIYINTGNLNSQHWKIYRLGNKYQRFDVQQKPVATAYSLRLVAQARLITTTDQHTSLQVIKQQQEIMPNDIVLPVGDGSPAPLSIQPISAPINLQANIKGSLDGYSLMAANHVVVIDRGKQDGLTLGSTFKLFTQGASIYGNKGDYHYKGVMNEYGTKQLTLPPVLIGEMVVICIYSQFSLALITQSLEPIRMNTLAVSPLALNH